MRRDLETLKTGAELERSMRMGCVRLFSVCL